MDEAVGHRGTVPGAAEELTGSRLIGGWNTGAVGWSQAELRREGTCCIRHMTFCCVDGVISLGASITALGPSQVTVSQIGDEGTGTSRHSSSSE